MASRYLSKDQLVGFEYYKYSSVDTSPLSNYVMHPFWNQAVQLVPRRIAPNVLTFSGFTLTTINTFLLTFYDYSFCANSDLYPEYSPVPTWVWLACAINHFLAHTLDGIDGKHARNTNSSGPLGELMDHGLDSWACLLMPTLLYSVFGRGPGSCSPLRVFFMLWLVHFCFYLSHWEKYITGVLYLPWGYDISQVVLLGAFLLTYSKSYKVWKNNVPILNIATSDATEGFIYACSFGLTIPVALYNIYRAFKENRIKQNGLNDCLRPVFSLGIFFLLTLIWAITSPIDVLSHDPRIFYYMVGTVFSNIACRLIVNQMTATKCETVNWMVYPVGIAVAIVLGVPKLGMKEVYILRTLTVIVVAAHIHYGVFLVRQLCEHFNINCFSLKKETQD